MKNIKELLSESALNDMQERVQVEEYLYKITKCDKKIISDELDKFIINLRRLK